MIIINKDRVKCPTCGAQMKKAIAMDGGYSSSWLRCIKPNCKTYLDTTIPMEHQDMIFRDSSRYIFAAGGYGWGKTWLDVKDCEKGALISPDGQTLFGAPTMPQLNSTLKKDFEQDFPMDFIKKYSAKENRFVLLNGHEFLYRSFDDPEKLRSMNLSRFVILEGSGTYFNTFTQLQNRLRNFAATLPELDDKGNMIFDWNEKTEAWERRLKADWRKGTIESNPDPGWVKTEILECSGKVVFFDGTFEDYHYHDINKNITTYVVPTKSNYLLPAGYVAEQSIGKPAWWVKRYFHGSFAYAEGMVYPEVSSTFVETFIVPKHWKRVVAMDYGISDNTHFIFIAIDPDARIAYVYSELVMDSTSVRDIVTKYRVELRKIPDGGLLCTPVMDQRSWSKRQPFDVKKTLGDLFEDEGVLFDPAQMDIDARVLRLNGLINLGQLKIMERECPKLVKEILAYKFPEKVLGKSTKNEDKPIDARNHGVNALEFGAMELPHNLASYDFTMYNRGGKPVSAVIKTPTKPVMINGIDPFKEPSSKNNMWMGGVASGIDDFYNSYDNNMLDNNLGDSSLDDEEDLGFSETRDNVQRRNR